MENGTRYALHVLGSLLQSWSKRLGHFVFHVRKMQFKLIALPSDRKGVGTKPWEGLVYDCVLPVSCKLHKNTRKIEEVSQNVFARIVASKPIVSRAEKEIFAGKEDFYVFS